VPSSEVGKGGGLELLLGSAALSEGRGGETGGEKGFEERGRVEGKNPGRSDETTSKNGRGGGEGLSGEGAKKSGQGLKSSAFQRDLKPQKGPAVLRWGKEEEEDRG